MWEEILLFYFHGKVGHRPKCGVAFHEFPYGAAQFSLMHGCHDENDSSPLFTVSILPESSPSWRGRAIFFRRWPQGSPSSRRAPGEVFLPGLPFPSSRRNRRRVHSSFGTEAQVVLERYHRPFRHGGKDEPMTASAALSPSAERPVYFRNVRRSSSEASSEYHPSMVLLSWVPCRPSIPAGSCGDMGVVPHSAAEGEKGHRHSGKPMDSMASVTSGVRPPGFPPGRAGKEVPSLQH